MWPEAHVSQLVSHGCVECTRKVCTQTDKQEVAGFLLHSFLVFKKVIHGVMEIQFPYRGSSNMSTLFELSTRSGC